MQAKQHSSSLNGASFTRILHFAVIFIGAALYISSALFDSVWFDEAYTVGAVSKSLPEMIYLLTYDVHPHLYYILLKVYSLIFGNSVITLRMFSVIFAIASTILGYTHIRKDFGEKAGFWFSFLLVFSFSTLKYALQIRMYTLAIFLLTLTAVYAYRYIKNGDKLSRALYLAFSILSAYTHYFAFFIVAMINVFTLVRAIKSKSVKKWSLDAVIQFGGYSVGLAVFIFQISLGGADWITISYPDVLYDAAGHLFFGDVISESINRESVLYHAIGISLVLLAVGITALIALRYKRNKDEYFPVFFSWVVMLAVLAFVLAVSVFREIFYIRYAVCFTPFIVFSVGFLISKAKLPIKAVTAVILIVCFVFAAIPMYRENFSENNIPYSEQLDVREGDIFILDNFHAYVCTIEFPENEVIYNNLWGWPIDETYALFGKKSVVSRDISEYDGHVGRVWTCGDATIEHFDKLENAEFIEEKWVHSDYYNYNLYFRLYEVKA